MSRWLAAFREQGRFSGFSGFSEFGTEKNQVSEEQRPPSQGEGVQEDIAVTDKELNQSAFRKPKRSETPKTPLREGDTDQIDISDVPDNPENLPTLSLPTRASWAPAHATAPPRAADPGSQGLIQQHPPSF